MQPTAPPPGVVDPTDAAVELLVERLVRHMDEVATTVLEAVRTALRAALPEHASADLALADGDRHTARLMPIVLDRVVRGARLGPVEDLVLQDAGRTMARRGVPLAVGVAALRESIDALAGAVLAHADPDLHLAAVTVVDRATQISYEIALALAAGHSAEVRPTGNALSPVARQVLDLAAAGHSSRRIAEELHYSEQAVTYHLGRLMREFGVPNRTALVAVAVRRGLVRLPEWRGR